MAESKRGKDGGFKIKNWSELDVSDVNVQELKKISEGTGVDFPIEADPKTGKAKTVPESVVVEVKK